MNDKQRWCLGIGGLVVVLMLLFPPWRNGDQFHGYEFITFSPGYGSFWIDWGRLALQVVAVVVGSLAAFLRLSR